MQTAEVIKTQCARMMKEKELENNNKKNWEAKFKKKMKCQEKLLIQEKRKQRKNKKKMNILKKKIDFFLSRQNL